MYADIIQKNKIWIRMIKMSEKCVITIEDVLYQAKRKIEILIHIK